MARRASSSGTGGPRGRVRKAAAVRVVLSTAPATEASRLARLLVRERLAACVSLVPGLRSVYRWKGRVERAAETLLVVKTSARRASACLRRLAQAHSYEVPEGIVLAPSEGFDAYLGWVVAETT